MWGGFEGNLLGLHWDNIDFMVYNYTFARAMYMMAASFVLFTALGLYLDKVLPKQYGERRPVYFCLTKKFCCSCCRRGRQINLDEEDEDRDVERFNADGFEA